MNRPRPKTGPQPVTVQRVERALDTLAAIMVKRGAAGAIFLPIYERLESELETMRKAPAEDPRMAAVYDRFKRSKDRKVATPS